MIRYEDVIANPEQTFRDIYEFLDEPLPKATIEEMQKMVQTVSYTHLTLPTILRV